VNNQRLPIWLENAFKLHHSVFENIKVQTIAWIKNSKQSTSIRDEVWNL